MAKKASKIKEFGKLLKENNITAETIGENEEIINKMKENAKQIQDYRHESYIRHLLVDVVMIMFFAVLANADEWSDIEVFAKEKEAWLRKYLELPHGIPTDDTIRLIISNIETEHFYRVTILFLIETINAMLSLGETKEEQFDPDIINVDGKESRGSKRGESAEEKAAALRTLNVYSTSYRMCLAQETIGEKTNEIPAAQEILKLFNFKGDIVTADAMNCQKETAAVIIGSGGDYVLAIKGNQKLFHGEVVEFFDEACRNELKRKAGCYHETKDKEHSGVVIREYYISDNVGWFAEREKWTGLKTFGMVKRTHKKNNGEVVVEIRYYICSIPANAELFSKAARGHWGIENNLHWSLDFIFNDDKNKSMAKNGAKNMQIMKKIVLAILEIVKASYKLSMAKIRYKLSLNFETNVQKLLSLLSVEAVENALN
jgi:predicted transposase YbfD/YdcC